MTKTTHIDSVDRADLLRLIGIRHIPSLAVFNSGKQGTTVHTVAHLPSFRYAKTVQTACWGPPPIPRQGPLTLQMCIRDSINDPQPAWNDITFFRMYLDHPAASAAYLPKNESFNPYILYDVAKASLNPGNRINEPLWALLSQIIPYYQTEFGIDLSLIHI